MIARYMVVALGGAAGSVARYWLSGWAQERWGAGFPYGTFIINVSGSFVLGLFSTLWMRLAWSDYARLLIAMGFLGAYTTFSTFEFESLRLIAIEGRYRAAFIYVVGSVVVGLGAAYLGVVMARLLVPGRGQA